MNVSILAVRGVLHIYGAMRWTAVCYQEGKYVRGNPFNNFLGSVQTQTDITDGKYDPAFDTVYLLSILGNGFAVYQTVMDAGWDNFWFAQNAVAGVVRLLMFIDKLAVAGIVKPQKPWVRYAMQEYQ